MRRIEVVARFHGRATRRSGEPPRSEPQAASVSVEVRTFDGRAFDLERVSYSNRVTHTSDSTFSEIGTIRFGEAGDEVDIETAGDGTVGASPEVDLKHGAVVYRIVRGRGRFAGASGLITSNFLIQAASGEFEEQQVAVVFLP